MLALAGGAAVYTCILSPLLLYAEDASTGVSPQSQHTTGAIENTRTQDTAARTSSMRLYSHCRQYKQQYRRPTVHTPCNLWARHCAVCCIRISPSLFSLPLPPFFFLATTHHTMYRYILEFVDMLRASTSRTCISCQVNSTHLLAFHTFANCELVHHCKREGD